jgi:protein-tyrosine phosphatase
MDWITERILAGNRYEALDQDYLKELGVTAILNLAEEVDYPVDRELTYQKIPLNGMRPEDLEAVVTFIRKHVRSGKVFIHCGEGINRTGDALVAYFAAMGFGIREALEFVRAKRPVAPHYDCLEAIRAWLGREE